MFTTFKHAIQQQFQTMQGQQLYQVGIGPDAIWELYLKSFPPGTNPIYRERTEHDCSCCKSFIRQAGGMVAIKDNKLVTLWDIQVGGAYQAVADAMSEVIRSTEIVSIYAHSEKFVGTDKNREYLESGEVKTWDHFYLELPKSVNISPSKVGEVTTTRAVLARSMKELTIEAGEVVSDLISQNSLYRGEEHLPTVKRFLTLKRQYDVAENQELWLWEKAEMKNRIRSTVIGTLIEDISSGVELEVAVKAFESKVAPENYKRTSALITKGMIEQAEKKVASLGIEPALHRRHAVTEDITINNVLFADRSAKKVMGVFDEIRANTQDAKPDLDKVEEVPVADFIDRILPKAESLELYVDNQHEKNLFTLVAPVDKDAPNIMAWDNNFSWAYKGDVTDSIKERVKAAGGRVDGFMRASLSWFNYDDLDLHCKTPADHIYYGSKLCHETRGRLDVDMNAGGRGTRTPVENIVFADQQKLSDGIYRFFVRQFKRRENEDVGFEVEFEFDGNTETFVYDKRVIGDIPVIDVAYQRGMPVKFNRHLPSSARSKEMWGIQSQKFHKVNLAMFSPNHWDGLGQGNRHLFFVLENCRNPEKVRGFYNEFLRPELAPHRKVFEVLGSKLKADYNETQLSGLGFSSTVRNEVLCRVSGAFNRTIKIKF